MAEQIIPANDPLQAAVVQLRDTLATKNKLTKRPALKAEQSVIFKLLLNEMARQSGDKVQGLEGRCGLIEKQQHLAKDGREKQYYAHWRLYWDYDDVKGAHVNLQIFDFRDETTKFAFTMDPQPEDPEEQRNMEIRQFTAISEFTMTKYKQAKADTQDTSAGAKYRRKCARNLWNDLKLLIGVQEPYGRE